MSQMPAKNRKQPKNFYREECEAENVCRARKPAREHRARHHGGVGAQGRGEFRAGTCAVVEGEDVEDHEPAA